MARTCNPDIIRDRIQRVQLELRRLRMELRLSEDYVRLNAAPPGSAGTRSTGVTSTKDMNTTAISPLSVAADRTRA